MKNLLDLVGAAVGLVLFLPVFVVIAIAIRIGSPGPVLFRQSRVGRFGREFDILKFRTMKESAELAGPQLTVGADQRITRIGRVLRRTKLDELPQLWNVLCGHMSLVGPRPEVPRYVRYYPEGIAREILSVRPGMTEDLSLDLRDEASLLADVPDPERHYVEVLLPRKLAAQLFYVRNRSLLGDVRIIIRTITELFPSLVALRR